MPDFTPQPNPPAMRQDVKPVPPAGTHEDPKHPGTYIADDPKAVQPKTLGQRKELVQNPPGPEVVEQKPSTETVTVLEGELYVGLDEIHQAVAILANHSAAGIAGSIIGEAVTLLQAGEARIAGLEIK
jgi:hypothetical protein